MEAAETTKSPENTVNSSERINKAGVRVDSKGKFIPGESGNPAGKPPGAYSLVAILKRQLQEVPPGRQKTYGEELISSMLHKGIIEKDSATHKLIMNYVEGMPIQRTDLTTLGQKLPTPMLYAISNNDSDQEDTSGEEADQGDSRGDSSG